MTGSAVLGWVVRLATVAGLGVDAGIHAELASARPPGGTISQGELFYLETVVACLAAFWVLLTGARWAYAAAVLVAASALGAVLVYRYFDLGVLGPLPDMYEPFWDAGKVACVIAEAVALAAAGVGVVSAPRLGGSRAGRARHRLGRRG